MDAADHMKIFHISTIFLSLDVCNDFVAFLYYIYILLLFFFIFFFISFTHQQQQKQMKTNEVKNSEYSVVSRRTATITTLNEQQQRTKKN